MKHELNLPVEDKDLINLKIGDIVYLNGILITARDQVHKRIVEYFKNKKELPASFKNLKGSAIYHCGPIIKESNGTYQIISGGPTTSQRMDDFENDVVKILGIKLVIGKGGMKNLDTKGNKIAYLSYTGGCGAIIHKKIEKIIDVEWKDFGTCEAVWILKVKDFGPLIVSQDASGNSLYK